MLLVVNPTASAVTPENRLAVEQQLGQSHEVTVRETQRRCHAIELAEEAAAEGVDALVVLAGDGTLNEAANGLVGSSTALGVLPGGSTNVFARTIGMGRTLGPATERLCAAMANGNRRRVGVGVANGRYFLFHVGIGFDAAVVEQVEAHPALKRVLGQVAFAYCAVKTWLCRYDRSGPRFTIKATGGGDGGASAEAVEASFAICLNTDPYTFVGPRPLHVDPSAGLDSTLSLLALRNIDLSTMGAVMSASLGGGTRLRDLPAAVLRSDVNSVTVEGHGPFPWQVDGDLAGRGEKLVLSHEPACLDLFVPEPHEPAERPLSPDS